MREFALRPMGDFLLVLDLARASFRICKTLVLMPPVRQTYVYEPVCEKINNLSFDQVRQKPICTVTRDG